MQDASRREERGLLVSKTTAVFISQSADEANTAALWEARRRFLLQVIKAACQTLKEGSEKMKVSQLQDVFSPRRGV